MIDTSVLIEYFRKTDKNRSTWVTLINSGFTVAISVIVKYEIYAGATHQQMDFWREVLKTVTIIPVEECSIDQAVMINAALKRDRKQIEIKDLLIAATAVANKMPLATLNKRHFERIDSLELRDYRINCVNFQSGPGRTYNLTLSSKIVKN